MSRVQLALRVPDLDASIAFHSRLFGTERAKLRDGYANFAITRAPARALLDVSFFTAEEPSADLRLALELDLSLRVVSASLVIACRSCSGPSVTYDAKTSASPSSSATLQNAQP